MPGVPKPKSYCRCGCGTEIKSTQKWVSGHNWKTKVPNAIVKNRRTYVKIKCDFCGKEAERRLDQLHRHNKNKTYCSAACANKANAHIHRRAYPERKTGKNIKCIVCNKEFYVQKNSLDTRKFCSKKCHAEWQKDHPIVNFVKGNDNSGKKNGMYKNGKHVGRTYKGNKYKVKKEVMERDEGSQCLLCGRYGKGLHLHRVIYGSHGGKYESSNCVQLCPEDHALVHSSKKTWLEPLLKYLKNPISEEREKLINLRIDVLKSK